MQLRPSLLDTPMESIECPTDLKACLNAHGLYNFERRSAPFLDKQDDGGIYPRLMNGKIP